MSCAVCDGGVPKYKCPKCEILYCSLGCWKEHKKSDCSSIPSVENEVTGERKTQNYSYTTKDTVPLDKLKLLGESKELQNILENPHLRDLLVSVDRSPDPARAIQLLMQEPLFVEFADECLAVVEPHESVPT